jgi:hypothetical protein
MSGSTSLYHLLQPGAGVDTTFLRMSSYPYVCQNILEYTYSGNEYYIGRLHLIAAVNTFGMPLFKELCARLWYGRFLLRLVTEQPTNLRNIAQLTEATSGGPGARALITFVHKTKRIFVRSFGDLTEEECIKTFYN